MRVLVAGWYHRFESTHAAIDVAAALEAAGATPVLLSLTAGRALVWPPWEAVTVAAPHPVAYPDWVRRADAVVFLDNPGAEYLALGRELGVRQVFVPPWSRLGPGWQGECRMYDQVLCSHEGTAALLRANGLPAATYCPWASGEPGLPAAGPAEAPRVLVVVEEPKVGAVPDVFMLGVLHLLRAAPGCVVRVLYSRPPLAVRRAVRAMTRKPEFGARPCLAPMQYGAGLRGEIAAADLVVYPAAFSDHAIVPLCAAACGVPVVCFDCPPMSGVAAGLSVDCRRARTAAGMEYVEVYDPAALFSGAASLLRGEAPGLPRLTWEERRAGFRSYWQQLCA